MRREVDPDFYCPQAALIDEDTNRRAERRLARYRAKIASQETAAKLQQKDKIMTLKQRQQRLWMAGGALVVVAFTWIWYKNYGGSRQKGREKRRGRRKYTDDGTVDGVARKQFVFGGEDEYSRTEEELREEFEQAANVARSFSDSMLDQRDQLMLYGLYKQALEGDRNIERVSHDFHFNYLHLESSSLQNVVIKMVYRKRV